MVKRMRVLHVVSGIDPKSGGPTRSVTGICRALSKAGVDVTLLVLHGEHEFDNPGGVNIIRGLSNFLNPEIKQFDLVHIQGLWDWGLHRVAVECRKCNVPYVISPRGMLDPWALSVKKWKKQLAMFLYQKRDLKGAAAFHVTAALEEKSVRTQGLTQPVIIAPNGVDLPEMMPPKTSTEPKTAIFLSRLHPGKGLLTLADAWARVKPQGWRMKVVGPDSYGHKAEVIAKLAELGIRDQWEFVDMLNDVEKWSAYREADLLIHPSVSENFGITIAEGLAAGLPAIATQGTPWEDLKTYNCGWWVKAASVDSLADALKKATTMMQEALETMGELGSKLITKKYGWKAIASRLKSGYECITKMMTNKEFDLERKFVDFCVKKMAALYNAGFKFENKEYEAAINGSHVMTDGVAREIAIKYYSLMDRIPSARKREIHFCRDIQCPADCQAGYKALKNAILNGENLLPRMSRDVIKLDSCDGMLSDWAIQHFHLGMGADEKCRHLIAGTSGVAYVFMTEMDAYVITIDEHGRWADQKLLEKLDNEFPEALKEWVTPFTDISYELDEAERKKMRNSHFNSATKVNGKIVMNPSGGEALDGTSTRSVRSFLHDKRRFEFLSNKVYDVLAEQYRWARSEILGAELINFIFKQDETIIGLKKGSSGAAVEVTFTRS